MKGTIIKTKQGRICLLPVKIERIRGRMLLRPIKQTKQNEIDSLNGEFDFKSLIWIDFCDIKMIVDDDDITIITEIK